MAPQLDASKGLSAKRRARRQWWPRSHAFAAAPNATKPLQREDFQCFFFFFNDFVELFYDI